MSDHRYTAIFGGALVTAGLATFAVYRLLGAAATPQHEPTQTVVIALHDVPAGVPVPREALGTASWPVRVAPSESFAVADSVIGRVTRAPLMPGEPVLGSRLATRGAAPGLEGAIDPARRAMAVRVNEAASLSGLVRANSRVDVLMATRVDGMTQSTGRLLMSDVRVLGVGSLRTPDAQSAADATPSNTTAAIVTLEVSPAQAEQLAAAEGQGAIQVVLRGYGSKDGNSRSSTTSGMGAVPGGTPAWPAGGQPSGMPVADGRPSGGIGAGATMAAAPRPAAPAPLRTESRHAPCVASAAPERRVPDSVAAPVVPPPTVVQLYRGGVLTVLRLESTASAPAPSTSPAAPNTSAASAARVLRTADAQVGMGAHTP